MALRGLRGTSDPQHPVVSRPIRGPELLLPASCSRDSMEVRPREASRVLCMSEGRGAQASPKCTLSPALVEMCWREGLAFLESLQPSPDRLGL